MSHFWRKIVVTLGYIAAGFLILAALIVSLTQLLTPILNDHRASFENIVTQTLNRPVKISQIEILWDIYEPELVFHDVLVLDPQTHQSSIKIPLIRINIDILNSLLSRSLIMESLKVTGVHLTLREPKPGQVSIVGFNQFSVTDNFTGHSLNPNAILVWIFSQPKLVLQKFNIDYVSYEGVEKDISLKWLALTNTSNHHRLTGKAILNQTSPTQATIRFNWNGNVTDLAHVSANLYLKLENISLAQWFKNETWHNFNFQKGKGNTEIWADWNQNDWQSVQSNLEFFDTSLNLNNVFGNPLEFDHVTGSFSGKKDVKGTWLFTTKDFAAVNSDLNATASATITIPTDDSPHIDLNGHFTLARAKNISNYLPLKIFDADLVTWLRNAFLAGQVESGQVVLQGRLSDFPFDKGAGKFEIGGVVKNVKLNYAPNWPLIENIQGKILFSNRSMTANVLSANIEHVSLQNITAEIPDLGNHPILTAKSTVQTDLEEGMAFIQDSPLKKTIGKNLEALDLHGPMQLLLTLEVPVNHPADTQVTGDTKINNAELNLPDWNLNVTQVNGAFRFTEKSITASNITAQLFGHPVSLDLATEKAADNTGYVTATLQGAINTTDLKSWLDLPVEELLQGSSQYKTKLILPSVQRPNQPIEVNVQSDLKGITINLPGQYGKQAAEAADFELDLFAKDKQPLRAKISYNKLFSLAMQLQKVKQQFSLLNADLHLGNGEANWQTQPGVIITGNLDRIDWDKIAPYVSQFTRKTPTLQTKNEMINPELFRALDIQTKVLNFSGLQLNNIRIQLARSGNNFVLGLNNADMAGQISFSRNGISQGIQARFQHLKISPQIIAGGKQSAMNPHDLPAISFIGEDVRYGDMQFGHAVLNLVPDSAGLAVKQLELTSSSYQLHAGGQWTNSSSHLQGNVTTNHVTELLKSWGFASSNLLGTKGDLDFDLNWPGGLFRPSLIGLSGRLSLKLGQGRIINLGNDADAKMGLGRLLNIFSLQSLPRRLSLNFSDLSGKGYDFDSLTGDFTLHNGNAFTQNTQFQGPIAGIGISGRIGLAAKDLDMVISVTPHVTASLPVVAAIATANPIAGVATFVVDKMVSPAVSHMTGYQYSITGSWANPVWNQIGGQQNSPAVKK